MLLLLLFTGLLSYAQPSWQPVKGKVQTVWSEKLNPSSVLNEYPRPQMQRADWMNLNGLWEYSIEPVMSVTTPAKMQGQILVPFAVESALSGVGKTVGKDSVLWYRRQFALKRNRTQRTILHFGAVDWDCQVFVNGKEVGRHKGGYDAFQFDITDFLKNGDQQELVLRVWDPTDEGPQPRGKQVKKPHGIWYTPVTGIWQTVWMEQVPISHIVSTRQTPDIDRGVIRVKAIVENPMPGDLLTVSLFSEGKRIAASDIHPFSEVDIVVPDQRLWSPADPHLYDIQYVLVRKGKVVDEVKSYFGMRKISMQKDGNGIQRMMLNNKFLFQYGPLDQGWWPDGLYTAPTDDALLYDIEQTKAMGFNMIRKHVKVEPARWYYHCDKLGMLVWQDMPSGDMGNRWEMRPGIYGKASDRERTEESERIFRNEWKAIIEGLYNFPSIVSWVPFNEAWGQFKTQDIVQWTQSLDPSRLVNAASGGNFTDAGHIMDLHNYPEPLMPDPALFGLRQILVLGEFGGLGLPLEGHTWQEKDNWGYQSFRNKDELYQRYNEFIRTIPHFIEKGLSAAVYTQTTDVEVETNGLMTYDRRVIKFPVEKMRELHQLLYKTLTEK